MEDCKDEERFRDEIDLPDKTTTYSARYTYATTLKRTMIPINLIQDALLHFDQRTTEVYLDSFTNDQLDEVNDGLL